MNVPLREAAKLLGISVEDVKTLEKQQVLHVVQKEGEVSFFSSEEIEKIKSNKGLTLAEEANQVVARVQQQMASSLSLLQKAFLLAFAGFLVYFFLIGFFVICFSIFPLQTASWLGYSRPDNSRNSVLGVSTSVLEDVLSPPLRGVLEPVSRLSLDIVKRTNTKAYAEVSKIRIFDPNDVLLLEKSGSITPLKPINIPESTSLQIGTTGLIANLNSEYLQGRKPGKNVGDIAIVEVNEELAAQESAALTTTLTVVSDLTNANLSGAAGITNANLAHSSITVSTSSGLSGGGAVALGSSLTLTNSGVLSLNSQTGAVSLAVGGINSIATGSGTITISSTEADTLGTVVARGASTATALTLSNASNDITAGTLTATGGTINGMTIGATSSSSGSFTTLAGLTINGLTITNNGSNTLTIAAGKTLTVNNSLTFVGTDGTTFTFPVSSDTVAGIAAAQTLTNKTITAGSNTITGLTNTNLSGSAGITNANLANSSLTVSAGTGLSGGGLVSLGSSVSLTNSGVLSLTGTTNQVNVSAASGSITVSLPQNVDTGASPTFSTLNLSSTSNQILFGTTNIGTLTWSPSGTRTLTLPDATDTLVGKATTDILTNKTLTAPAINGIVTTTGLTLPAFTASGNIAGSGSPTISSFGSINGLTLTSASDGFTIAGGTTSRTLTVTGADINVGSTIKPSASGALTLQSNGANELYLDAGGLSTVNVGTTSASAVTIGRSGITTSINGTADAANLKIGSGTTITKHLSGTNTFDAANIALGSCGNIGTVTVTGAAAGDTVVATPTAVSGGIETLLLNWNAYVSSTNTVTIRACSVATLGGQDAANQIWRADVWQH